MPPMETAIQFHLPTYNNISVPELIDLGKLAHSQGVSQIWVTDNLRSRNSFVTLVEARRGIALNLWGSRSRLPRLASTRVYKER